MSDKQFSKDLEECMDHNLWLHGKQVVSGLNWIFRSKSFPMIYELGIFPDIKELSESIAGFRAVQKYSPIWKDQQNTAVFCIGDGVYPRTASIFSIFSKFDTIYSIDPLNRGKELPIERLHQFKMNGEVFLRDWINSVVANETNPNIIICGVHSHAPLDDIFSLVSDNSKYLNRITIIDIPCCYDFSKKVMAPHIEYKDWSIISPKNTVRIWNF